MKQSVSVANLYTNTLVTASAASGALDLGDYEGFIAIILKATAQGSGVTNAIKITHSDTSGGSYTDVTGGGFTSVGNSVSNQALVLNSDEMKRFIKLDMTVSGGTGSGYVAAGVVGDKKYP